MVRPIVDNYFDANAPLNIEAVVQSAAYSVLNKFRQFVELDDLISVGWEWVLKHPEKMNEYQSEESVRLAAWRLDRSVWKDMERYARKERAFRLGYSTKDEMAYSPWSIGMMLPYVFSGQREPDRVDPPEIRTMKDPAEGGDFQAAYMDVERAFANAGLTPQEILILLGVYADGDSQEALAVELEISQATVSRGHDRALRKMQKYLGGPPVGDCPYSCECHEGKLRVRPGTRGVDSGRNQLGT